MSSHTVGCIIPTFQNVALLEKHLPAVLATLPDASILTIIEDAGSDDTVHRLAKRFKLRKSSLECTDVPTAYQADSSQLEQSRYSGDVLLDGRSIWVQVLRTKHNQRFAQAVNLAIMATNAEFFFLCNNDVSPNHDTIAVLLRQMSLDLSIFGIGCLEYSSTEQTDPSGRNRLWFEKGLYQHARAKDQTSGTTAWVSGGSGMFNRSHWLALGGFDAAFYPAYWEDIDISFRARKRGLKVLFTDQTFVLHQHETTNKNILGELNMLKTSWQHARYFTWKHASLWQKFQYIIWQPYWQVQELRMLRGAAKQFGKDGNGG